MTVSQFDGNAYESSQAAELTLNAAILRAEIARSYEEFLEIFDKFYADDVEVSSEESPETIRGKERVRPFLLNFLVPLHVMADRLVDVSSADSGAPRQRQRDTFRVEDRLHRHGWETVHFEMDRHSQMEGVQGCVRTPLRS